MDDAIARKIWAQEESKELTVPLELIYCPFLFASLECPDGSSACSFHHDLAEQKLAFLAHVQESAPVDVASLEISPETLDFGFICRSQERYLLLLNTSPEGGVFCLEEACGVLPAFRIGGLEPIDGFVNLRPLKLIVPPGGQLKVPISCIVEEGGNELGSTIDANVTLVLNSRACIKEIMIKARVVSEQDAMSVKRILATVQPFYSKKVRDEIWRSDPKLSVCIYRDTGFRPAECEESIAWTPVELAYFIQQCAGGWDRSILVSALQSAATAKGAPPNLYPLALDYANLCCPWLFQIDLTLTGSISANLDTAKIAASVEMEKRSHSLHMQHLLKCLVLEEVAMDLACLSYDLYYQTVTPGRGKRMLELSVPGSLLLFNSTQIVQYLTNF